MTKPSDRPETAFEDIQLNDPNYQTPKDEFGPPKHNFLDDVLGQPAAPTVTPIGPGDALADLLKKHPKPLAEGVASAEEKLEDEEPHDFLGDPQHWGKT